ncbi:MAG: CHAT domain-containing protein [Spirulina sp.]
MNILHLSDLHFGTLTNARNWYSQIADDLKNRLTCSQLDILILSGDIANKSTPKEYEAAKQFIKNLQQEFHFDAQQIVIVPGNHDLNWSLSKRAYRVKRIEDYKGSRNNKGQPDPECTIYREGQDHIEVLSPKKYQQRFKHFNDFYKAVTGEKYPLEYSQQAIFYHFPHHNLLILGLNSAWQLDHYYKSRVDIFQDALSNAIDRIRNSEEYKKCRKFAVWHHPINSSGEDRLKTLGFMQRLTQSGFCVAFHGHIHKAEANQYRPEPVSAGGAKIHIICAGTFGAPTREWVPGYPLQYNYLKLVDNKLIVETRCRRELDGEWKPNAIWEPAPGKDPLPRYEILLPEITATRYSSELEATPSSANRETPIRRNAQITLSREQLGVNFKQEAKTAPDNSVEDCQNFKTMQKSSKSPLLIKRVLIIAVCPKNTVRLRLDEEVREIFATLRKSSKFNFIVEIRWAVRIRDLREAMLEFEPHIVHFCGHGGGKYGLAFEDERGQAHLVSPEALNELFELFSKHRECLIECIILSACYTEVQANAMTSHVGCIIGMAQEIGDRVGIEFSKGFYQALSNGTTLDIAFQFGCNAIQTAGLRENLTPILKKSNLFSGSLRTNTQLDSDRHQSHLLAQEKILILAANPRNTTRLRLDEEMREIYAVLAAARKQGTIALEQRWAARFSDLQEALFYFQPTIIHFAGHGGGNEGLAFEDETGDIQLVKAQTLLRLLKPFSSHIKCVILNAPYSQVQARVLSSIINYVIGLPNVIFDKDCVAFSRSFYRAIGADLSFEKAYDLGCTELSLYGILEEDFPILNKK